MNDYDPDISDAEREARYDKKKAALKLGVNRTTLYNKLRQHNLLSYLDNKAGN